MNKIKDLLLLAFWGAAYLLKTIIETPCLWVKDWFKK
tara:strand:+ start:562 stop:672 length:111 start_codon:yes stop_codon:yes gene_type:complete